MCRYIQAHTSPKGLTDEALRRWADPTAQLALLTQPNIQIGSDLVKIIARRQEIFTVPSKNAYLVPLDILSRSALLNSVLPLTATMNPVILDDVDNATFKLYISWPFTWSYPEHLDLAPNPLRVPSLSGSTQDLECLLIPYEIKAGIIAGLLGHRLQDIKFQNHAMYRHVHAVLCQSGTNDPLTFRFVSRSIQGSKLNLFLERMLCMNWGDEQKVVGGMEDWYDVFSKDAELVQLFLEE
jgi:hypothetical protein